MNEARSLKSILDQLLKDYKLESIAREAQIPDVWLEVIGERAAEVNTILRYDNNQLMIQCQSSVWRTELRLREAELRQKMNERLKADVIREIVFR